MLKTIMTLLISVLCFNASADNYPTSKTNKAEDLVVEFYEQVFNERQDVEKMAKRYLHRDYIQHNPYVATGRQGFIDGLGGWLATIPTTQKWEIKKVISDGNLVVLHIHVFDPASGQLGSALVDIFRVKGNKIIEHWDVMQEIPEWMAHDNGMF